MIDLKQHSQALRWEHKIDFRPPKKSKEITPIIKATSRPPKRKTVHTNVKIKLITSHLSQNVTDKASPNPKRIKTSDQCRRKSCRQRNTHTNHTHNESKFKESDNKHHPNLGKAPAKKQRNAKTNASQPVKNAQPPGHFSYEVRGRYVYLHIVVLVGNNDVFDVPVYGILYSLGIL
jgi:hypothetical protein